jgi:hypothetical protein
MYFKGFLFQTIIRKLLWIIILIPTFMLGQVTFEKAYGYSGEESGRSVLPTIDSGYIICGYTDYFQFKYEDVYLIKTDESGNIDWTKNYGNSTLEQGWEIRETTDGGYIIAAERYSPMYNTIKAYLLKTNLNGDTLWTKLFTGLGTASARCAIETNDGNYIFCGVTSSSNDRSAYMVKTDVSGEMIWEKAYAGPKDEWSYDMIQNTDGGYILCGGTEIDPGFDDFLIIRTDAFGDTVWTRHFGGAGYDAAYSIIQNEDEGNYYVGGLSWNTINQTNFDILILKLNSNGDTIWTKRFGGGSSDKIGSMDFTEDGGIIVCGSTTSFGEGGYDLYLFKIDTSGTLLWSQTYGGANIDVGISVHPSFDQGYILCGYTSSFGAGNSDIYLVKTDSDGLITGVEENFNFTPTLNLVYPNPNHGIFNIELPEGKNELRVYNQQGQLVYKKDIYSDHTNTSAPIEIDNLPKDIFFIRIIDSSGKVTVQKIIVN